MMRNLIIRYALARDPMRRLCRLLLERPDGVTVEEINHQIGVVYGANYINRLSRSWTVELERDWYHSRALTDHGYRTTRYRLYRLTADSSERLYNAIQTAEVIGL